MSDDKIISRKLIGYEVMVRQIEDREVVQQEWLITEGPTDNPTKRGYVDKIVKQPQVEGAVMIKMFVAPEHYNQQRVIAALSGLPIPEKPIPEKSA